MSNVFSSPPPNDTAAAAEAGAAAVKVADRIAEIGGLPVVLRDRTVALASDVVAEIDKRQAAPRRVRGLWTVDDPAALIHVLRNRVAADTEVWLSADDERSQIVAVIDAARWRDERVTCDVECSPEWDAWEEFTAQDEISQIALAEFLEERFEDLVEPPQDADGAKPVDLLAMARDLTIHTTGQFKRKVDTHTGTGSLIYSTEHGDGSTKIPRRFYVALRPWEGGDAYRVEARLKFALVGGHAAFAISLHRLDEVWTKAWSELQIRIAKDLRDSPNTAHVQVYRGKPPGPASP